MVRRLSRLSPKEKKKIVGSQLMAILTYGAELHSKSSKRGEMQAAEWNRFITGGWRGSSRERLADIAGIAELREAMKRQRIRWAASIYERGVEELKEVAEKILKRYLEEDTVLRWPEGSGERVRQLEVVEPAEITEGGAYTDGSRIGGHTAAATITQAIFLARYATVMDAELLAIAMGWEIGDAAITDSQAAIGRIQNMQLESPKGWIEESGGGSCRKNTLACTYQRSPG